MQDGAGEKEVCHTINDDSSISTKVSTIKQPISKNQLKKQLKRERWLEGRGERRKLEREKKKAARRLQAKLKEEKGEKLETEKFSLMSNSSNKFRVVIDMNFEAYMTDAEIGKAVQQVGRIYALNRHSKNPCQLFVTSLKGKIKDIFQFKNAGYVNWDINHSELSYSELFRSDQQQESTLENTGTIVQKPPELLYLSGDSEHLLPDVDSLLLDNSKIFVIGGLVDHNRHKNLCYQLAVDNNIPTAKLPIKEHVTLCQRHILSTVAVFEILLRVLSDHQQWPEALKSAIPKRKLAPNPPEVGDGSVAVQKT